MKKPAFFALPHLARRQTSSGDHPAADLLAAFAEQKLLPKERATVVGHLAECSDCRDILAFTSAAQQDQYQFSSASGERGAAWWPWRVAALAAVLFLVLAAAWQFERFRRPAAHITQPNLPLLELNKPQFVLVTPPPLNVRQKTAVVATARAKKVAPVASSPLSSHNVSQSVMATALQPSPALTKRAQLTPEALRPYAAGPNAMFSSDTAAAQVRMFMPVARNDEKTVWGLEGPPEPGVVKKSDDGGKTWHTVPIDGVTRFYALSATGSDIWVGGGDGKLFRSTDNGAHWNPIAVFDGTTQLSDVIVGIDSRGQNITLRTISGLTFTTNDGGVRWHRQ